MNHIKKITIFDKNYPKLLKQIYDPPRLLYYLGEILPSDENAIAVVGSRRMTKYGQAMTKQFTKGLVKGGLTIVSGLARGVDSEAHLAAIENGGRTIAVLGSGLNRIYPAENRQLAQRIISGYGAVISEFPPDYPPMSANFPQRNRIIAGLSKAVLVTQAHKNSGSQITARLAIDYGREVFVIPADDGSSNLIQNGAIAVFNPEEILDQL